MKQNFEKLAAKIGAKMLESGAEIFRVEDTITRILEYSGAKSINVFCISSIIIISTENGIEIIRVKKNDLNLFEIERLNSLSRAICSGSEYSFEENLYPLIIKIFSVFLATGSFCIYFGGNIFDAIISGIIGNIINFKPHILKTVFSSTLLDSAIAGVLAFSFSLFTSKVNPDKIMIGTIMLLIPGLTVSNAIRDIMTSDILSGIIELFEAIFTAFAIALGFSFAVVIFK